MFGSENNSGGASFMPSDYVKGKGQARASALAIFLFVLVLAGLIGVFFVNHQRWRRVSSDQQAVEAAFKVEAEKIEQLKVLEAQRMELTDKAEIITALRDRVPRSVLMGELVRGIGASVVLTDVSLTSERVKPPAPPPQAGATRAIGVNNAAPGAEGAQEAKPKVHPPKFAFTIEIDGIAPDNADVADYLAELKKSPLLRAVELVFINSTTIDSVDYRKFKVTMKLRDDADARMVDGTHTVEIDGVDLAGVNTDDQE